MTGLLKRADPAWWWLRENFKLPSLIALAGCLATSGAWIYSQHGDLEELKRRDPTSKLESIAGQLSAVLVAQSALRQQLADFGDRLDAQDRKWERVERVADSPPRPRRNR